jgi:photosystem II stability/assembly factor-like uncharacterized protein
MTMFRSLLPFCLAAVACLAQPPRATFDSGTISGLGVRNIGSATMSGRISALDARVTGGRTTLYVGAASGGVWRSLDDGTTFKPVFDRQAVQSIGAITIDPKDPRTVWVGTGEAWTRNSVSAGDGIYKTTDGGETWACMGLPASERISKIVVDPAHGDTVFACVPGPLWSDSAERGLYRTRDGGKSWALVLKGGNLSTGCSSLAMDPRNPNKLLATLWDFRRQGWTFRSGGEGPAAPSGGGLYLSEDGGNAWRELTPDTAKGLPAKPWGRSVITMAPSNPDVIYLFVESARSALFRSADGGRTWEERDRSQMMVWRPFYFAHLVVDPTNPERVFKPDLGLVVSTDGGRSFSATGGGSHGDWHDVWIDPGDPLHLVGGDDGGLWQSRDGGNRWARVENLPVSQFYHVSLDNRDPYQVYGGLQDNSSWVGDSAYPGGITNSRWENLFGGDGFWVFSDPADPHFVYAESQGGYLGRVDRRTLSIRDIQPKAGAGEKLRFNWNAPVHLSPHEPGTLYLGAQFLFRTRDHGATWDRISPDLTTNDPERQKQEASGGITVDNSSAEMHTTLYSISESPKAKGLIWVGTDDGNLQVTRDAGGRWENVASRLPGVPAGSWISWVEAGPHDAKVAYVAVDRHTFGDFAPRVFRTTDGGATWASIVPPGSGIRGWAQVIKEDPVRPGLLYLGTEFGLWISPDHGRQWAEFKGGTFPAVAVRDLAFQARDGSLAVATHGRGIWIIDDLAPLRALDAGALQADLAFVGLQPVQQRIEGNGGWPEGDARFRGENPTAGAVITYFQRSRHLFGELKLEVLDAQGRVVASLPTGKRRGLNRVVWPMRETAPLVPPGAQVSFAATSGPRVLPGTYRLRLTKDGKVTEAVLEVGLDRRATFTLAERRAQHAAAMRVHGLFGRMSVLAARIMAARDGASAAGSGLAAPDPLRARLAAAALEADALRKRIVATTEGGAITGEERLREHMDLLYGALVSYEGAPAATLLARTEVLERELADLEQSFEAFLLGTLAKANEALKAAGHPVVQVPAQGPPAVAAAGSAAAPGLWRSRLGRRRNS